MRLLCCVAALLLAAMGCGGPSEEEKTATRNVQLDRLASAIRDAEDQASAKRRAAALEKCNEQIGPLLDALGELDSRLDIGMNYDEYGDAVGDASVAYDRVPVDDLDFACINAATQAEKALNAYVKAYNVWNNCFKDLDCDTDSIEPQLQTQWSKASTAVDEAREQRDAIDEQDALGSPEEIESEARLAALSNREIPQSPSAKKGIYTAAVEALCEEDDVPLDRRGQCRKLEAVLAGGVDDDEVDDLDDAVKELNIALGVTAPDEE